MYDEDDGEVFLGMSAGAKPKPHAPDTAKAIDEEVRGIVDDCYSRAKSLLEENIDKLHLMAESLIDYETLNSDQIDDIMAGAKPRQTSDDQSSSGGASSTGQSPIGGPAEEH